jgi:hypothetical protein
MRVVDGMHRVFAALLKNREEIEVEFFDGDDAFLRAVEANVAHGYPLSQADRRAAAARIITTHPYMSNRAIARSAGIGAKTVAAIRRSSETAPQPDARLGRDGRVRPVNSVAGRQRAAELLTRNPDASLREVARLVGVSPATVGDVRSRLERGELPANVESAQPRNAPPAQANEEPAQPRNAPAVPAARQRLPGAVKVKDPVSVLEKLLRDPSLRGNEEGRNLLRLLRNNAIGMKQWEDLAAAVPPHCGDLVLQLAQQYAELWREFSCELNERVQSVTSGVVDASRMLLGSKK